MLAAPALSITFRTIFGHERPDHALCDAVVLLYREVGQSSSGPLALALEMGCRVLASRTHAFLQFARYHPQQIEFFDIGNDAELAGLIRSLRPTPGDSRVLSYNAATNAALHLRANRPYPVGDDRSD